MTKPALEDKLSRIVMDELDPALAKLCSQMSPTLSSRVSTLVNQALPFGIQPDRLVKYAFLYATAEVQAQGDAVSINHATRAKYELAGQIHGLASGYQDIAEAKRLYRVGRRACQQIQSSLEGLMKKWQEFEQVVQGHRSELPLHLQSRFSNEILRNLEKVLHSMQIALVLDEEDFVNEKRPEQALSAIAQTYIWWCSVMPRYRGRWTDMHQLAYTWRMSPTESVRSFRNVVTRICKGATWTCPFVESWRAILYKQ